MLFEEDKELPDHCGCGVCGFEGCIGVRVEKPLVRGLGFEDGGAVGLRAVKLFKEGVEFGCGKFEVLDCAKLIPLVLLLLVLDATELPQWLYAGFTG